MAVSQKLVDAMNDQMAFEFYSAHIYLSMAAYCAAQDLPGFVNYFRVQLQEEHFHANRFFDYLNKMHCRIEILGFENPQVEWPSLLDMVKHAYDHEKIVTSRINNIANIAADEKDNATANFMTWYIDEQTEEESNFYSLIKKLERIGDNAAALYQLDGELAARVFIPPTNAAV